MSTIGWPQPEAASIALPSAPPEAAMGHLESSAIEHELASEHLPLDELYAKRQIDRRDMLWRVAGAGIGGAGVGGGRVEWTRRRRHTRQIAFFVQTPGRREPGIHISAHPTATAPQLE
jgi:hypothetical protein